MGDLNIMNNDVFLHLCSILPIEDCASIMQVREVDVDVEWPLKRYDGTDDFKIRDLDTLVALPEIMIYGRALILENCQNLEEFVEGNEMWRLSSLESIRILNSPLKRFPMIPNNSIIGVELSQLDITDISGLLGVAEVTLIQCLNIETFSPLREACILTVVSCGIYDCSVLTNVEMLWLENEEVTGIDKLQCLRTLYMKKSSAEVEKDL